MLKMTIKVWEGYYHFRVNVWSIGMEQSYMENASCFSYLHFLISSFRFGIIFLNKLFEFQHLILHCGLLAFEISLSLGACLSEQNIERYA